MFHISKLFFCLLTYNFSSQLLKKKISLCSDLPSIFLNCKSHLIFRFFQKA